VALSLWHLLYPAETVTPACYAHPSLQDDGREERERVSETTYTTHPKRSLPPALPLSNIRGPLGLSQYSLPAPSPPSTLYAAYEVRGTYFPLLAFNMATKGDGLGHFSGRGPSLVDTVHVATLATLINNEGECATEAVGSWTVGIVPQVTLSADLSLTAVDTTTGHC